MRTGIVQQQERPQPSDRALPHVCSPQVLHSPPQSLSTSESAARSGFTHYTHLILLFLNSVICNYSPLPSDSASSTALKANDVVKIQIGAHIDGYAAVAAETVVVGASSASPVTGRAADVIKAAHTAAELAIRIMKPGATNLEVAKQLETVVKDFECRAVEGMQSNLMDKDVIDGKKKIVTNPVSNCAFLHERGVHS